MKTKTVMRADLRADLKDPSTLWSNAELDRCIDRAVADLSRYLPRELHYEEILSFTVTNEAFTAPVDTDIDRIVDGESLTGKVAGNTCTIDGQPDLPRFITATITDADNSITGLVIIISGFDKDGLAMTETLTYQLGQSKTLTGKQYFNYISSVELNQIGGTTTGDTLELGVGAYTDVWVYLANKPIKEASDTGVDNATHALARNTDYKLDYANGRIKAIAGGNIAASESCTLSYKKESYGVDLSTLPDLIRIQRVEYPVGNMPQNFCQHIEQGGLMFLTGSGEQGEQTNLSEGRQVRIYYDATHQPPTDYAPGTIPTFLENTILQAASAYALFIYALKFNHQATTDLATSRTAVAAAESAQTAVGTALTNLKKYLDNNSSSDAESALTTATGIYAAVTADLDAAAAFLAAVATDLSNSDGVSASYIGTTNYVSGGSNQPDIAFSITTGAALINSITEGGENERTPEMYSTYAQVIKNSLVAAFEQHRAFYQQDGTIRTNAALAYVQNASQRVALIRATLDESTGWQSISALFAREAEDRLTQVNGYLAEAAHAIEEANSDMTMADKFNAEATLRRDEVYSIWRDRKEYIGNFSDSSMNQIARGG